ncbi:MAG: SurA N-terminal domain-containing protein [Dehalococcoidia bacterium]
MSRFLSLPLLLVIVLAVLVACGASSPAAIVNGEEISTAELDGRVERSRALYEAQGQELDDEALVEELRELTLDEMITDLLLKQKGREQGIDADHAEVEALYDALVERSGGEAELEAERERQGLTREELMGYLVAQAVVEANVAERLAAQGEPTEAELREMHEEFASYMEVPPFEEVRDFLADQMEAYRWEEAATLFLDDLRADATVEKLL